jgi:hypothetical protein
MSDVRRQLVDIEGSPLPGSDPGGGNPTMNIFVQDGMICISITDEEACAEAAIAFTQDQWNKIRQLKKK